MFSVKESKNMTRIDSLIGEQCKVVGDLSGKGLLKIDGSIEGNITWDDDVILGVLSTINGNLTCKNAIVAGKIHGNVVCNGSLSVEGSGKIVGDITIETLSVKEGGIINGNCSVVKKENHYETLED
ncbi:MAG: polymer-forming cytoskeletal protein [Clostridiales bacterium]|uniref:bactofilin family protein n=1 Tax=Clostridium sp. N3C TaxID=1776758 RepID=UPI00092E0F4E|nr:polymer-forming cytoskeletal protein [Clostridium sp. N3C]NLZ49236.1 polymer-forming cytoskeletal protein [Clostridiales bacterium]SCN24772.1 Polymer-forming cytoskeletal [Clostridium sp. N3C]